MNPAPDHRSGFRIEDTVHLRIREVGDEEYGRLSRTGLAPPEGSLRAQLHAVTRQLGGVLLNIRREHPEVAQYLQLLDRKIELLAQHLEAGREGPAAPETTVDLGQGGIGYLSDTPLPIGAKVEVQLVLFPSRLHVASLGHVAHQEPEGGRFRIGVQFDAMDEPTQELLARHLIELQSAQIRRDRGR